MLLLKVAFKRQIEMENLGLVSEVEMNQDLVSVGNVLFYGDSMNVRRWTVIDSYSEGFTAIDSDGFEDSFTFNELQYGWTFSDITKIEIGLDQ